ncbi:MAG: ABC transporter permease [Bacteroidetes bacterium]|nr:MAG: ABC transporter permease [Bacteroidota bacterium]
MDIPARTGWIERVRLYPEIGAITMFLVIFGFFALLAPNFLSVSSLSGMLNLAAVVGTVAIGATVLMVAGEFDLSVGATMGLAAMAYIQLCNLGVPEVLALTATFVFAGGIGLLNAAIVLRANVSSFIATLGTLMVGRSLLVLWTGGNVVRLDEAGWVTALIAGRIHDGGLRMMALWFVVLIVVFHLVMTRRRFGNAVYAVGGNPSAARTMGIQVERVKVAAFLITSWLAAFAGVMQLSRIGSINALTGQGFELQAIAAAVVGGALLTGGYGSVLGTLFGALVAGMVRNGLILMGFDSRLATGLIGLVLIIAVIINTRLRGEKS